MLLIESDIDPYDQFRIGRNPDGTITRYINLPRIKASLVGSHSDPVVSKDLTLNPKNKTRVRIYMPTSKLCSSNDDTRIPIIIFFAGSGWILRNWDTNIVHSQCSALTQEVHAIVVNVDYRIAPEHRLPVQYEDAMDAVLWVREQALDPNGEQWIREYGDISRCYLHGTSNGGNMVFFTALEATSTELEPLRIAGNIMNQPLFGGMERTNSEIQSIKDPMLPLCVQDMFWELSLPEGVDRDIWYCNPMVEGPHTSAISKLGRCLVIGFCGDAIIDRQQEFVTMLVKHGVQIEAQFSNIGFHAIELIDRERANYLVEIAKDFINNTCAQLLLT
ncbi:putative carboxylesterase 9 [Castanea sativa]|uniref:putative carboxylesterase 9 n=1 Tax=Castanea sativa TaxID=21020 RepID=UPI003F650C94